jgi:hypothetical protein
VAREDDSQELRSKDEEEQEAQQTSTQQPSKWPQ